MSTRPANSIQDLQYFGEYGGVNPSIEDSSTYTFLHAQTMEELFEEAKEGCYLYARHTNPNNKYLSDAIAGMEGTEAAHSAGSGMGSITTVLLQLCNTGDEIVSSRTILCSMWFTQVLILTVKRINGWTIRTTFLSGSICHITSVMGP